MEDVTRRLTRARTDRVFGGVCGGLARYLGWDAVVVRVAYVILSLISLGLGGLLLYFFAWMLIPLESADGEIASPYQAPRNPRSTRVALGVFLAIAGVLALMSSFLPWFIHWPDYRVAGPLLLVLLGVALIMWRSHSVEETQRPLMSEMKDGATFVPPPSDWRPSAGTASASGSGHRLVRLRKGRKIAGISAGLGEYFGIDPTIIRLLWIVTLFFWGTGLLLYLILWIVMPLEDSHESIA